MQRMLVHEVKPKYPESAKKAGIKGTVRLQIIVDRDGRVIEVKPLEGDPGLAQAAGDAVRHWRYKPVRLNGVPVQVDTRVELKFH
jgi:TonB family protein